MFDHPQDELWSPLYAGKRIIENSMVPEFIEPKPVKNLEHKRWMLGRGYYDRINKKWLKEFGLTPRTRWIYVSEESIVAHPNTVRIIREETFKAALPRKEFFTSTPTPEGHSFYSSMAERRKSQFYGPSIAADMCGFQLKMNEAMREEINKAVNAAVATGTGRVLFTPSDYFKT